MFLYIFQIVVNSRYARPTIRKYGFKIEDTGFMYLIETPTNVRIQWFHTTGVLVIELNATSDPKSMGLCGKQTQSPLLLAVAGSSFNWCLWL